MSKVGVAIQVLKVTGKWWFRQWPDYGPAVITALVVHSHFSANRAHPYKLWRHTLYAHVLRVSAFHSNSVDGKILSLVSTTVYERRKILLVTHVRLNECWLNSHH